ncbi:MAG: NAD(P)/FAD-dependent oxidoreductase, partial [Methanobacteriota archaeon]
HGVPQTEGRDGDKGEEALEVDVLIVGAGPAGSTTARYCSDKNIDVLMIDRRKEIGHPVQCGELLPDVKEIDSIFPATAQLNELFDVEPSLIAGRNSTVKIVSPGGRGYMLDFASYSLDRRKFDKHLVKLAEEAGARLCNDVSLLSVKDGIARTSIGDIKAKVVVGADGPNSLTAREAGLDRPRLRYPAITGRAEGQFDDCVEMFFGSVAPGGYAWIIPKDTGANVGLGFSRKSCRERPSEAFERFKKMIGARTSSTSLGFVPMSGPVKSTVAENIVLVGDAAGQAMPSNGGGIPTAMIAGREAGRVIRGYLAKDCKLTDYERRWRSLIGEPLKNSLRTRRLADVFFPSNVLLGLTMAILGTRGLDRAIRCRPLFL